MSIDIASLAFKVDSGEIAQAETRLDSMDKAGSRAERGAGKLTGAFKVLGGAIAAIGIASTVRDALAAYNSYESMSAGLKSVTGSAEAASQAMSEINDFAKTTPYVLEQSLQGYQRLKSLGLDPSTASMRSYGNTATAMRKDMVQMIEAVADATTGEFERLKEFGIKAKKSGDDISFTFQGVTTTVKNSSEDIQGYLQDIGNNQFAGSMDNAMQTVQGAVSNLDDAIFRLQVRFIESTGLGEAYRLTLLDVSDFLNNEGTDAVDAMARAVSTLSFEFDHMGDVWGDTYDELMKENADTLEVMEGSLDDWFNTFGVVMGESLSEFRKNINYMPVTFKAGFESMSLVLESWYLHSVSYWEKFKSMVLYVMASVDVSTGEVFSSMLNMGKDFIGDLIGLYAKFGEFAQKIVGFFGDDTGTTWLSKTLKEGTDSLNESSKAWKSNTSDVSDNAKWLKEQAKSALDSSDRNKAAGIAAMNAAKQVKENAVAAIANYEANRVLDRALKDADESFKGLKSSTSLSTKEIKKAADATGDLKDKKVKLTDAQRDAIRMTESLRTAQEKHDAAIKAATKLLASKHITEETFNREKIRAAKELSDYHARAAKELAKTSTETLSTYERERRALEISKTAKLDGAEAAYRLRLSYDDIRGSQADLLVNLKRQSGAFDEVAKKAVKLTEAQKKAAEDQRLLNSVYAEVATPIDNYNTTKAELNRLSKIEGANLALIQVALKEAHSEYKKTLPSVIENAKAQKELVSVYAQVQTPLESYNKNKARLNELLKVEGADTEMVNRALKKQAEEYKKTTPEYEARTKAAKDLLAVYSSVSTPLEKFNSEKERLNKLSEIEGANIEFINRALKANQLAYDQTVDSIQDKVKFDKHLKDAQESNRTSLDLATKSYGRSEEAVVSLSLQLNSKYGKALADSEAKIITKRVEQEKLNSAYSSAKQAVKDSSEAADLARNSIGKTDEEISALTLSLKVGYNPEMSRAKAANDAAAISYGQIHALIKEMRTPAEQLSHELKSLNDLYDTGELDAETYARAQAAIKESFDENVIAAKELKEEVDRLGNSLTDTLTSSILSGDYEGIGSKLVDTFKNDILNPILDQAIKPFTEALSNSMAGAGNSISGMMGGSKSLFGQSGSGIMSMLSGGGLSGAIGAGGLGMAFGQAIGQSGIGTSIGAAIGNIIMPGIGGIIGGGLGTLVEGIFGGSKETVGTGVQVGYSGDFSGKNYEDWFKKGGWFSSDKEGTNYSAMDSEISETMNGYFTGVKTTIAAQAAIIFQRDIAFYDDILASFVSGSTKLSGSDISAQITSWAEGITDEMYESIFESTFGEFKLAGETLTDTVNRMVVNAGYRKERF